MRTTLYLLASVLLLGLSLFLASSYRHWKKFHERERFLLSMREITTPRRMDPVQRARLAVLQTPWWAFWRWLPDRWQRPE
nr:hypothetical protein [Vicinamibacteria bacterium]